MEEKEMQVKKPKRKFTAKEKLKILNALERSSIEYVAEHYHCSERSIWRWKSLYDGTIESLQNKSSRAKHFPREMTAEEKKHILDLKRRNPDIGLNELYGKMRQQHDYKRNPVTLFRFLRREGYYTKGGKKKKKYVPKKYDTPIGIGEKWQMDVKYIPKECNVTEYADIRYYQYTMIDEATRERYIYPYRDQCQESTVDFVLRAIKHFGYRPKIIQTDNGQEFTYLFDLRDKSKVHEFEKLCKRLGIIHQLIRPRTPRHNGKVERSHRNDNERFYSWLRFYSFDDLQKQMSAYLRRSNNIPISILQTRDKINGWLTPNEKRKELLLLDWGIVS